MAATSTKALCLLFLIISSSSIQLSVALATMAIDLGSEFIKIAIVKPGVPMEIALNVESQRKTPTVVAMRNGDRTFHGSALNQAVKFPPNAFLYVPRLVGKKVDSPQIQQYKERFPFHKIEADENGYAKFQLDDKTSFTAEELLAMLLENCRDIASKFAEFPVKDAVITVPPFFTQAERRAVVRAARLIGMNVLQLMNDNTATALNYGIFRRKFFNATAQYYMFYDLGSSATRATIVSYHVGKSREGGMIEENPQLTVIGVGVDQNLGATPLMFRLRDHLAQKFVEQKKSKKDITKDNRAMAKLFKEAGRVMRVLSANKDCFAQIEGLFDEKDFKVKVTRADFEKMNEDLLERVAGPVDKALEMAQIPLNSIKEVLLMGGGTRIPLVQELLLKATQKTELGKSINTDEAAALGAVYQAAHLTPGFRVKRFVVKDGTYLPIKIDFERLKPGETQKKQITRTLFSVGKTFPHKMSITFNKHVEDFSFHVGYGQLSHLTEEEAKAVGSTNLTHVHLKGVTAAHKKFADKKGVEAKGVKARFKMDDSGILSLEHVEALFEKSPEALKEEAKEESTLSKIGSTITNLFGGSSQEGEGDSKAAEDKKDPEKKDEKKEEKKEKKDESPKDDNKTDAANKTAKNETKPKELKPQMVREHLTFSLELQDMPDPSEPQIAASTKIIDDLRAKDEEKKLLEKARNELESFVFESKDKLYQEDYEKCSEETEREKIRKSLTEIGEWYEEQGEITPRPEYESRLKTLQDAMKDLELRVKEMRERPRALQTLKDILNNTEYFHRSLTNLTGEGKVFTQTEVDTLSKLINETKDWKTAREVELAKAPLTSRAPVTVEDIMMKAAALDREVQYLLSKAKYWTPPTPPANATDTSDAKTDANTTKTEAKGESNEKDASSTDKKPEDVKTDATKNEATKDGEKASKDGEKATKDGEKATKDSEETSKQEDKGKAHGGEL